MPAGPAFPVFPNLRGHPVHSCSPPDALRAVNAFVLSSDRAMDAPATKSEFSINELAREFSLTHRALRFYESRGLLSPEREGRRRIFSREDRIGLH